jgi:hypothetical protein
MKLKENIWLAARTITGILCMYVSFLGLFSLYGLDLRPNPMVSTLFFVLPTLSIFVFTLVKRPHLELALQAVIAAGYLTTFSMLNWRTCSALGYCGTVLDTVLATLQIRTVLAAWGVVLLTALTIVLDRNSLPHAAKA